MSDVQKVTPEILRQVIDTRQPLGLFYAKEGRVYVGVDNSTGDAWTEAFRSRRKCRRWLENPGLTNEQKPKRKDEKRLD